MDLNQLLARARGDDEICAIDRRAARGAEAYFQAYQHVAEGNPDETPEALRELAMMYLDCTASPPLNANQITAAKTAQSVLERLSA